MVNLRSLLTAPAEQRFYRPILFDHVSPAIGSVDFVPDTCYLRVWLNDMYLVHKRVLYQTRSPVVHAKCRFNYAGTAEELRLVVGPGQCKNLAAGLDRTVNLNYPVLGPVPYRGGDVELLIALLAVESADYADQLIDVLGVLSEFVGRGEIKAVLPFLQSLKAGIEGLFGMKQVTTHLAVHDTLTTGLDTPNRLSAGYRVVMDVTDNSIDPTTLWVRDGRLYTGLDLKSATPFEAADYFLFYIEKIDRRQPPFSAPVTEAWDAAMRMAVQPSQQELDFAVNAFKTTVLTSPDLIFDDQRELVFGLVEKVKERRVLMGRSGFAPYDNTSLDHTFMEWQGSGSSAHAEVKNLSREEVIGLDWK